MVRVEELCVERIECHLSAPAGTLRNGRWGSLIRGARLWCREHAKPWVGERHVKLVSIGGEIVELESGTELTSGLLAEGLRSVRAHGLVVAAFSAGHEIHRQIESRWAAGRPDEAMALNACGITLVEGLREREAESLRRTLEARGIGVLPYFSPGYDGWPLEDQTVLFGLVEDVAGPIEVLGSGALRPRLSTLAVFGLTRDGDLDALTEDFWALERWQSVFSMH